MNFRTTKITDLQNTTLVYGLGISGLGVLRFFSRLGICSYIFDDNSQKIDQALGIQNLKCNVFKLNSDAKSIKYIVCSPGISPEKNETLKTLVLNGAKIITDIDLAKIFNKTNTFIGITGTNGKSTTTSLVSFLLNKISITNALCGNIGKSPLDFCIDSKPFDGDFVVEVSSYQASMLNFNFNYTAFLNITPDHVERHGSFDEYLKTKLNFVLAAERYCIINQDDEVITRAISKKTDINKQKIFLFSTKTILAKGLSICNNDIFIDAKKIAKIGNLTNLLGEHNLQNIACALSLVHCICIQKEIAIDFNNLLDFVNQFKPLEHRIEFVKNLNGVLYYNDSKATNVQSCEVALKCFKNVILLAGGVKKEEGLEYFLNKPWFFDTVKTVVCYGQCGEDFYNTITNNAKISTSLHKNFKDAVLYAKSISKNGDIVLLSPCCASFDEFNNFEHRGQVFKQIVNSF
jgi:UDP-N-acetylmuramoylalanine--D-glutamate ligase